MIRSFDDWWKCLPENMREISEIDTKKIPQLNKINYIWVSNLINNSKKEFVPSVEELVLWIKNGEVNARSR